MQCTSELLRLTHRTFARRRRNRGDRMCIRASIRTELPAPLLRTWERVHGSRHVGPAQTVVQPLHCGTLSVLSVKGFLFKPVRDKLLRKNICCPCRHGKGGARRRAERGMRARRRRRLQGSRNASLTTSMLCVRRRCAHASVALERVCAEHAAVQSQTSAHFHLDPHQPAAGVERKRVVRQGGAMLTKRRHRRRLTSFSSSTTSTRRWPRQALIRPSCLMCTMRENRRAGRAGLGELRDRRAHRLRQA